MIKRLNIILLILLISIKLTAQKPNILIIMTDDMGYSDVSCYGGEIKTPAIDQLANNGVRFSKFYASPMCVTSRVALMSGMEFMAAGGNGFPKGISIASLLRDAGYSTNMIGKVHGYDNITIGDATKDFGFDHFFGFAGGEINSFNGSGSVKWQNDGTIFPNTDLPKDFYTTKNFTDYAISYIGKAIEQNKPFFTFLSFNAPHTPLGAPEANVRKYYDPKKGINVYEKGWDKLREERLERMKRMGLVNNDVKLSDAGVEIPKWDLLPDTSLNDWELQKKFECLSRSAYAGMVDNIDENVARLIAYLKDPNNDGNQNDSELDNTIILFTSDNGGCYAGLYTSRSALPWSRENRAFTTNYGWAALSNTPFRYYKHASHEGAIRCPMIVHWPAGLKQNKGSILHNMVTIWDFYPTFLELAGTNYPTIAGKKPLMGKSFLPLLKGESFVESKYFVSLYTRSRGIIKNNWKLTSYYDSPFELYDLDTDPSETNNLAKQQPTVLAQLIDEWNNYTVKHGFANDASWNRPLGQITRGWGYDNIRTRILSTVPEYMSENVDVNTKLTIKFKEPISFSGTEGKKIRLQKYGVPGAIWSADPTTTSKYEGKTEITFDDFPVLEPNSHYNITWDGGWVKYNNTTDIMDVRECAYAFRFKTGGDGTSGDSFNTPANNAVYTAGKFY